MNKTTETHKRATLCGVVALIALLAFTPFALGGTLFFGTDGTTGARVKTKTTPSVNAAVVVPNHVDEPLALVAADVHAPTSNTAAVVTYAANATKKHVIYGIAYSYTGSGTLAGGNLKVEDVSGTTVFTIDIDAKGSGTIIFPRPLRQSAINTALIITLAAGSANVTGKVSILGHDLETP